MSLAIYCSSRDGRALERSVGVSWQQGAEGPRRDVLVMSRARRQEGLAQAMDLGFVLVRSRASRGLVSVDASGV